MILVIVIIILLTVIVTAFTVYNFVGIKSSYSKKQTPDCKTNHFSEETPKIKEFKNYLIEKMRNAIVTNLSDSDQLQDPKTPWKPGNQFGIAIYMKDTPIKTGPLKAWASFCGGWQSSEDVCDYGRDIEGLEKEPSFYFGSGTKPITATLTASKLYEVWKKKKSTKSSNPEDFINWYAGKPDSKGVRGGLDAVNYRDLFNLTHGFDGSNFTETVSRTSNTQSPDSAEVSYTQRMQDWIFCCPKSGLIPNCPADSGLFCDNNCEKLCPIPLNNKVYGKECKSPFCPNDLCTWACTQPDGSPTPKDPNAIKWESIKCPCTCKQIPPSEYTNIINNLSIYNVTMMRSGIPDSDSIWSIDTAAQLASRTNPIGPVQFVSEILGFDWNPLWDSSGPITPSGFLKPVDKDKTVFSIATDGQPTAMYSSSAYTFLGSLLWLLTSTDGEKDWSTIDLNALLPKELYCLINFAGTSGNSGRKYFISDKYKNQYYSYEATVSKGNVVHSPPTDGTPITNIQTTLETVEDFTNYGSYRRTAAYTEKMRQRQHLMQPTYYDLDEVNEGGTNYKTAPVYQRDIWTCGPGVITNENLTTCVSSTGTSKPIIKKLNFVDWDSSSGVMCGNGWGTCSGMAEIYMNIFSPTADHPIMPKEVQKSYVENFLQYQGPNWRALYNNKLRAPFCMGGQAWSQGYTYNCGSMGPDWFYIMNRDPGPWFQTKDWNDGNAGVIPCYGHLGDTYGYCSCHIYFPGGTLKAYHPLKNNSWAYVNPTKADEWSLVFEFSGGLEFTISCTQNSCISESQGPIQQFIYSVVKDPFNWD
tara:strand:+ start:43 stop:2469 length:2427 start_codon:yes stop_codon:yes gene_type:complete